MLGALVGGRIGIPRSGLAASRSGLTIAIRYGDGRRQFGPEGGAEVPILNYRAHQRRLIPKLANTYALHFALRYLTNRYVNRKEEEMQEIEALAAGLKAIATWHTSDTLQECREACGGKGYLWENRIGTLKNDTDITPPLRVIILFCCNSLPRADFLTLSRSSAAWVHWGF